MLFLLVCLFKFIYLFLFILFSLFCSVAVIYTILSSSSLMCSSASIVLLLIPCSVFLISVIVLFICVLLLLFLFFISSSFLLNIYCIVSVCASFFSQDLGSSLLSLLWILFQGDCLSLLHLVVLLGFYLVPSSGIYSSAISFCLTFCVCGPTGVCPLVGEAGLRVLWRLPSGRD